jgi:hypothetical protein
MLVQTITRFSDNGSNAEVTSPTEGVWMVIYHDIDTELKGSMYVGMDICESETEAYAKAHKFLEKRKDN